MKDKFLIVLLVLVILMDVVPAIWWKKEARSLMEQLKERNKEMEQSVIFCENQNDSLQCQKFQEALKEIYRYDREELQ